jgi:hypothetical protein
MMAIVVACACGGPPSTPTRHEAPRVPAASADLERACRGNDAHACALAAELFWTGKNGHPHDPVRSFADAQRGCDAGEVEHVSVLKSTLLDAYDRKVIDEIYGWRYRPFRIDGAPAHVCTAVTFIYSQS